MARKAGWRAEADLKAKALHVASTPVQVDISEPPRLSAADRNNPSKLSGDALRAHAHRCGLAKSTLGAMSDEKIREQLRYIVQSAYT